jgi:hypothetical protein
MTRAKANSGADGEITLPLEWHQIFRLRKRDPARAKRQGMSAARVIPILSPAVTSTERSRLKT